MKSYEFAIIIDDDITNNLICENLILNTFLAKKVRSFITLQEGYKFLETCIEQKESPDLILLDLRFPEQESGWDFLDKIKDILKKFTKLPDLYILTSSIASKDMERAKNEPLIKSFISKPLSTEKIRTIFS
jgi:response regulator RpfG family c-di-GMP phosphodiesterase